MSLNGQLLRIACLPFACFFLATCTVKYEGEKKQDTVQYVTSLAQDSIDHNPHYVIEMVSKVLPTVQDSLDYYSLIYLKALANMKANSYDSVYTLSTGLLRYCSTSGKDRRLSELESRTNNLMGNYYLEMFIPDSAFVHYQRALSYIESKDSVPAIINLYINMADASTYRGDYPNAVWWYRKAFYLADSSNLQSFHFPIHSGLGRSYMELRDYEQSDSYYTLEAPNLAERTLSEQFMYCNNRGNLYYYWKKYANALPWFKQARSLVEKGPYVFQKHLCGLNLADTYLHLNQLDSALHYLNQGEVFFSTIDNKSVRYYNLAIRAGIALKQGDLPLARTYFEQTASTSGIDNDLVLIRNDFFEAYCIAVGDYKNAYLTLSHDGIINDSLRNDLAHKRAATYDLHYKMDTSLLQRDNHIARQQYEIKKVHYQNTFIVSISVLSVLITVFLLLWLRKKQDLQRLRYNEKMKQLKLQNIRNRLSPHFVFNVLNGISSKSKDDERITLLIQLLRDSLIMADEKLVTLKQELDFVQSYIALERSNLGKPLSLNWTVDPLIDLESLRLPPLIVQIPVENAFKHALRQVEGEKRLTINLQKAEGGVRIRIEDNGPGLKNSPHPATSLGTGMRILRQTIDYLNTKNPVHLCYTMQTIEPGETGTRVELFIPETLTYE